MAKTMLKRGAGILMPVSSLPSPYGIGTFGACAYEFADKLVKARQSYWQVLPLGPTSYGDSPYQSFSAFAGNPYFIDLDVLKEEGLLTKEEIESCYWCDREDEVKYDAVCYYRFPLLKKAFERSRFRETKEYETFCQENSGWLEDYALYMALKGHFNQEEWLNWEEPIRRREPEAVAAYKAELSEEMDYWKFLQFKFYGQWDKLRAYVNEKGIQIIGDIPIYVALDSADVWVHPELFQLDQDNVPLAVAGCPPDGFSATGQLWGNPLYRWDYHRNTGYQWWISRMSYCFRLYDVVRIDHFRGFDEYFSIPYGDKDAKGGHWEKGPGIDLFRKIEQALGWKQVIAEDLGYMTDSVRHLVYESGFPGMKVLEFAFDSRDSGCASDYLPHNYPENCVAYTGTHDNETIVGWWKSITATERKLARDYLCDHATPEEELYKCFISLIMRSAARVCVIPMQDYMGLDNRFRMNKPSTVGMNWKWRIKKRDLTKKLQKEIHDVTLRYGRKNWD